MSEDFKCQADDIAKGDVVSANASSIERGAETLSLGMALGIGKAVADCCDPPVIRGIFSNLNEMFPEVRFELDDDYGALVTFLGKRPIEEEPSGDDERPLQAQHQPDIEKARAIAAATTDELRGITDKGPFHLAYYIPSPSKFVAAIATALREEREACAKFVENWPHVHPNVSSSIAKGIRTGDTHD
jgi:hypothetical protein